MKVLNHVLHYLSRSQGNQILQLAWGIQFKTFKGGSIFWAPQDVTNKVAVVWDFHMHAPKTDPSVAADCCLIMLTA